MTINKHLRFIGSFVFNCLIAIGGAAVLTSEIRFNRQELQTYAFKVDAADAICALVLGYIVYRSRKYSTAKWIWIAAICWWSPRVFALWLQQHQPLRANVYVIQSVFRDISGAGCPYDRNSCTDWMFYTTPSLRVIFYSAGAWLCSWFRGHDQSKQSELLPRNPVAQS